MDGTTTYVYFCILLVFPLQQVAKFELTGNSSLYILLPISNTLEALQELEGKMTYGAMQDMIREMRGVAPQAIEVTLPLIKLDHQPNMHALIKKLGLLVPVRLSFNDTSRTSLFFLPSEPLGFSFSPPHHSNHPALRVAPIFLPLSGLSTLFEGANLCGLYSGNRLVLDDVRHKAFLALTEQGVEAGAATSMSFSRSYNSFSALQPFVLVLWNDEANVPLFIGRLTDP